MWSASTAAASPPGAPNGTVPGILTTTTAAATSSTHVRTTSVASSNGSISLVSGVATPAAVTTTSATPITASPVVSGSATAHYAAYIAQGGSSGYAGYTVPSTLQQHQQQPLIPSSSSTLPLPRYSSADSASAATVLAANYNTNYSYLQPVGSSAGGHQATTTSASSNNGYGNYLGPPVSYSFQSGQGGNTRSGYPFSNFHFEAATPPTSEQGRYSGGLMLPAAAVASDFAVPQTSSSGSMTMMAGAAVRTTSSTSATAVTPPGGGGSANVTAASAAPTSQQASVPNSSPASTAPAGTPINNTSNSNNTRALNPTGPAATTIASASSSFLPPLVPSCDSSGELEPKGSGEAFDPDARAKRREALCKVAFAFVDIHRTGYLDEHQNTTGLTMVFHQLGDVPVPKEDWFTRVFANFLPPGQDLIDSRRFTQIVQQWDEHHRRKLQAQAAAAAGRPMPMPSALSGGRSLSSEPACEPSGCQSSGSGSSDAADGDDGSESDSGSGSASASSSSSGEGSEEEEAEEAEEATEEEGKQQQQQQQQPDKDTTAPTEGEGEGEDKPGGEVASPERVGEEEPEAEGRCEEMEMELSEGSRAARDRSATGEIPGGNSGALFGSVCRSVEDSSMASSYVEQLPFQGSARLVDSSPAEGAGEASPSSSIASAPAPPPPPQRTPKKQSSNSSNSKQGGRPASGSMGAADLAALAAADPASAAAAAIVAPREGELEPEDEGPAFGGPRSGPAFTASNGSSPPRRPGSSTSSMFVSRDPSRKSTATRKSNAVELTPDVMYPTKEGRLAIFDDYEFFGDVGAGAFGKVMVVRHRQTKQMRACKNVAVESALQRELIDTEVQLLKSLNHPNIMAMHEVYYEQSGHGRLGNIFLVTELCEGGDLFSRILHHYERLREAISESQSAFMMKQILSATKYCHDLRIVHRDIKPENILFVDRGANSALKIIDFGLANFTMKIKEQAREIKVPKAGAMGKIARMIPGLKGRHLIPWNERKVVMQKAGTPHYMAPEMLEGNYDEKADIFSIGIIFCQLLTGWHPFYSPGDDEEAVRAKIASPDKVEFPAGLREAISPDARDLALKLVEKKGKLRITAGQALNHSWFLDPAKPSPYGNHEALSVSIFEGLMQYQAYNKLKKAVLQLLTRELSEFQIQELRSKFLALDKEGDGLLSPEELMEGMRHVGYELNEAELEQLLYSLASPLNQKIGYKEFISALIQRRVKFDRQQLQECFNRFDTQGIGRISYADVQRAISASISESEWHEITTGSGRDGAARDLTFDEFVSLMEQY